MKKQNLTAGEKVSLSCKLGRSSQMYTKEGLSHESQRKKKKDKTSNR